MWVQSVSLKVTLVGVLLVGKMVTNATVVDILFGTLDLTIPNLSDEGYGSKILEQVASLNM